MVIIALYVDDFFLFHNNQSESNKLKKALSEQFKMKDLGKTKSMVGIEVNRCAGSIKLTQTKFIESLVNKFGLNDAKSENSPADPGNWFEKNKDSNEKNSANSEKLKRIPYQSAIGSLMYLAVNTRPDIAFIVTKLSQFNQCFYKCHWKAVKRVIRYLKTTQHQGLVYRKSKEEHLNLTCHSDADWANSADARSFTGVVVQLGHNTVSWISRKQYSFIV